MTINWTDIFKYSLIYALVFVLLSLFFSLITVESVERVLMQDPAKYYTVENSYYEFESLHQALTTGDIQEFLKVPQGFVFKHPTLLGEYIYYFDTRQLENPTIENILIYIKNNKVLEILKTSYISSNIIHSVIIFPTLLIIWTLLSPIIMILSSFIFTVMYAYSNDSYESYITNRFLRSQFLEDILDREEKSKDYVYIIGLYLVVFSITLNFDLFTYISKVYGYLFFVLILYYLYIGGLIYNKIDKEYIEHLVKEKLKDEIQ